MVNSSVIGCGGGLDQGCRFLLTNILQNNPDWSIPGDFPHKSYWIFNILLNSCWLFRTGLEFPTLQDWTGIYRNRPQSLAVQVPLRQCKKWANVTCFQAAAANGKRCGEHSSSSRRPHRWGWAMGREDNMCWGVTEGAYWGEGSAGSCTHLI